MSQSCSRLWQVEAAIDGRLQGKELNSFERHAKSCKECRTQARAIDTLQTQMRVALAVPEASPFQQRRMRHELLKQADEILTGREQPSSSRWWRYLPIASTAVCGLGLLVGVVGLGTVEAPRAGDTQIAKLVEPPTPIASQTAADSNRSTELNAASLEARQTAPTEPLREQDEPRRVSPEHQPSTAEPALATSNDVRTQPKSPRAAGKALSVSKAPRTRIARRQATATTTKPSSASWLPRTTASLDAPRPDTTRQRERVMASRAEPQHQAPEASSPDLDSTAELGKDALQQSVSRLGGELFGKAVDAFSRGDFTRADQLLQQFAGRFPRDPRAEDATFLAAVARQRLGDQRGAARAARRYLKTYPRGFRSGEARAILTSY